MTTGVDRIATRVIKFEKPMDYPKNKDDENYETVMPKTIDCPHESAPPDQMTPVEKENPILSESGETPFADFTYFTRKIFVCV